MIPITRNVWVTWFEQNRGEFAIDWRYFGYIRLPVSSLFTEKTTKVKIAPIKVKRVHE